MQEDICDDVREARHEFGDCDWTPEQKAAFMAKLKAEMDPVAMEKEFRELLELHENGLLIPFEKVLADLGIEIDGKQPDRKGAE